MIIGAREPDDTAATFYKGCQRPLYEESGVGHASSAFFTAPFVLSFGHNALVLAAPPPNWLWEVLERISALGRLEGDWDSYGASPVDPTVAASAVELLLAMMDLHTPVPSVVPTSRGGIQIEWHRCGIDLEIDILSPERYHVSFHDQRTGTKWEKAVQEDFAPIRDVVHVIGKRA